MSNKTLHAPFRNDVVGSFLRPPNPLASSANSRTYPP